MVLFTKVSAHSRRDLLVIRSGSDITKLTQSIYCLFSKDYGLFRLRYETTNQPSRYNSLHGKEGSNRKIYNCEVAENLEISTNVCHHDVTSLGNFVGTNNGPHLSHQRRACLPRAQFSWSKGNGKCRMCQSAKGTLSGGMVSAQNVWRLMETIHVNRIDDYTEQSLLSYCRTQQVKNYLTAWFSAYAVQSNTEISHQLLLTIKNQKRTEHSLSAFLFQCFLAFFVTAVATRLACGFVLGFRDKILCG